jgi:hypothetical protein
MNLNLHSNLYSLLVSSVKNSDSSLSFFLKKSGPYSYSEKEVNLDISLYISDKKPTDSLKLEEQNFKVVGYV